MRLSIILAGWLLLGVCSPLMGQDLPVIDRAISHADTLLSTSEVDVANVQAEALKSVQELQSSFDSLLLTSGKAISKFQSLMDSVKSSGSAPGSLLRAIDSVAQWRDRKVALIRSKVDSVKARIKDKTDMANLPGTDQLKQKLDGLTEHINIGVPNVLPANTLDVDDKLSALLDPFKERIALPKIEKIDLANVTKNGETLVGDFPEQMKSISTEKMNEVAEVVGIDQVKQEIGKAAEVNESVTALSSEEAAQEMIMSEIKDQAVDHFAGKEAQIQAAIEDMAKFKRKFESAIDVTKLPRHPPNSMKDRSFRRRLLPGLSLQVNRKADWTVDFNPYVGYWINGHIVTGIGWNHRIGYSKSSQGLNGDCSIFGPRIYGEYLVAKGFSLRLETELMKVVVPTRFSSGRVDENGREWVFGALVGIKKSYRLIKRVNGTAMMLYNTYNPENRSPYQQRLCVRIGIEIQPKTKKKI